MPSGMSGGVGGDGRKPILYPMVLFWSVAVVTSVESFDGLSAENAFYSPCRQSEPFKGPGIGNFLTLGIKTHGSASIE